LSNEHKEKHLSSILFTEDGTKNDSRERHSGKYHSGKTVMDEKS
jgi:hypothetical protein